MVCALGVTLAAGCGTGDPGADTAAPPFGASEAAPTEEETARFRGGAASLDELGTAIVAALSDGDTARLEGYRLTEREHNELLWPRLPIAMQRGPAFPVALAWENITIRNAAGLRRVLGQYGGEPLVARGVDCAGAEPHGPFTILTDCRTGVVDPGGTTRRLQIFRSVVVLNDTYKIIRYEHELE